ncbi:hypothetical protein BC830DRAFT_1104132 [Chytriomyces sp. MP71]|nr:hypothetical protein BC830DRAFT_1104132 [Chytriomyces sp. MP71]
MKIKPSLRPQELEFPLPRLVSVKISLHTVHHERRHQNLQQISSKPQFNVQNKSAFMTTFLVEGSATDIMRKTSVSSVSSLDSLDDIESAIKTPFLNSETVSLASIDSELRGSLRTVSGTTLAASSPYLGCMNFQAALSAFNWTRRKSVQEPDGIVLAMEVKPSSQPIKLSYDPFLKRWVNTQTGEAVVSSEMGARFVPPPKAFDSINPDVENCVALDMTSLAAASNFKKATRSKYVDVLNMRNAQVSFVAPTVKFVVPVGVPVKEEMVVPTTSSHAVRRASTPHVITTKQSVVVRRQSTGHGLPPADF